MGELPVIMVHGGGCHMMAKGWQSREVGMGILPGPRGRRSRVDPASIKIPKGRSTRRCRMCSVQPVIRAGWSVAVRPSGGERMTTSYESEGIREKVQDRRA